LDYSESNPKYTISPPSRIVINKAVPVVAKRRKDDEVTLQNKKESGKQAKSAQPDGKRGRKKGMQLIDRERFVCCIPGCGETVASFKEKHLKKGHFKIKPLKIIRNPKNLKEE